MTSSSSATFGSQGERPRLGGGIRSRNHEGLAAARRAVADGEGARSAALKGAKVVAAQKAKAAVKKKVVVAAASVVSAKGLLIAGIVVVVGIVAGVLAGVLAGEGRGDYTPPQVLAQVAVLEAADIDPDVAAVLVAAARRAEVPWTLLAGIVDERVGLESLVCGLDEAGSRRMCSHAAPGGPFRLGPALAAKVAGDAAALDDAAPVMADHLARVAVDVLREDSRQPGGGVLAGWRTDSHDASTLWATVLAAVEADLEPSVVPPPEPVRCPGGVDPAADDLVAAVVCVLEHRHELGWTDAHVVVSAAGSPTTVVGDDAVVALAAEASTAASMWAAELSASKQGPQDPVEADEVEADEQAVLACEAPLPLSVEAHATAVDLAVAASMVTGPSGLSCATAAALTISMAIDDELDVGTVIDIDALVELGITPPPVSWVQLLAPWHAFHAALPDTAVAVAVAGPMLDAVPDAPCVEAWRTSVASALGAVTTSQAAAMTPKRGTAAAAVIVSGPDVLAVDPGCDAVAAVAEEPWAPESLRFHDALAAVAASTAAEVHSGAEHDVEADHDCDTEPGLPVCLAAAVLMLGPWPDQVAVWGADMPADRVAAADRARPSSAPLPPDVAVHPFGFVPDVLATARSLGGLVEGEGIRNAAVPATAGVGLAVERLSLDPADAHAAILVGIDRCGPTPLYGTQASPQATMAVEQVCDAAHADGVELTVVSAWRSPHAQEALHHQHGCDPHQTCVTADGTTIAPVGASHHQHGAAVDFAGDLEWLHDVVGCLDVASTVLHAAGPISAGTYADAVVAAAAVGAGTPAGLCGSGEVPVKRAQTFGLVPLCGQVSTAGWLAEASPGAADSWSTPEALRCEKGSNPTREPWHFYVGSRLVASTGVEAVIAALWPAEEVSNALEVVARESGGNPTISNVNTDGTTDWGLWQFNDGGTLAESYLATYGHAGTPAEHLAAALDPVSASEMALTLWTVRWWQPWAGATAAGINAGLWSFESGPNDASGGLYAGSGAAAMAVRAAALPG